MNPSRDISRLLDIMAALRTPGTGCSWDLAQDFASIAPYTIEEAFEVVDAIERDDRQDLRDELGDLLLQVVFHARIAEEEGSFDFGGVVEAITTKLIRRHPHVFGNVENLTPAAVKALWADIKAREKADRIAKRPAPEAPAALLDDIPASFPPLLRASKLQAKASMVGFDWNDTGAVIAKIAEELDEVRVALSASDTAAQQDEIGDLLFAVVNLALHAGIDADAALRGTNAKFERRFGYIERTLGSRGSSLADASLDEMEALWGDAKAIERKPSPSVKRV
ncbi:nucleoside triphosphate pyrophosphohydrolase [Lichenihabitans sp. PAMC28606]|uniref:nucleoside triphosphate pyrophosphohydrolase n=1 Tax=Lichenihabitans sp. PAMC28606 TaxID=2880932 RepID=UPI001D0AF0BD|nr:nucleoside triphosphate pyrophosphohydrolase [Lichenihabitans sp. PAMC28606]UDL95109.1 nucleoside triphosphate pyrophosphohydrolase [Lichenihabitans sp. PAMC28606]